MRIAGNKEVSGRFVFLDGLRGLAALAVVVGHVTQNFYGSSFNPGYWLAVPFFFVLSAFVLDYAYSAKLRAGLGTAQFYWQRAVRLYPLVILSAMIAAAYAAIEVHAAAMTVTSFFTGVISSVTAFPVIYVPKDAWRWPLNHPLWSLFWELCASAAFVLICRSSRSILIGIAVLSFALLAVLTNRSTILIGGLGGQAILTVFCFAVGPLLFRYRAGHRGGLAAAGIAAALIYAVILYMPLPLGRWGNLAVLALVSPAVVFLASYVEVSGLSHKLSDLSGELSYPMYVVHWPIMLLVGVGLPRIGAFSSAALTIVLAVIAALGASRLFDIPVRQTLRRSKVGQWSVGAASR